MTFSPIDFEAWDGGNARILGCWRDVHPANTPKFGGLLTQYESVWNPWETCRFATMGELRYHCLQWKKYHLEI